VILINIRFLLFLKKTKARVNIIKIKTEIKLLGTELGKGGEGKFKIKTRLSSGVKSYNM
jgi:hypothetical protein